LAVGREMPGEGGSAKHPEESSAKKNNQSMGGSLQNRMPEKQVGRRRRFKKKRKITRQDPNTRDSFRGGKTFGRLITRPGGVAPEFPHWGSLNEGGKLG